MSTLYLSNVNYLEYKICGNLNRHDHGQYSLYHDKTLDLPMVKGDEIPTTGSPTSQLTKCKTYQEQKWTRAEFIKFQSLQDHNLPNLHNSPRTELTKNRDYRVHCLTKSS